MPISRISGASALLLLTVLAVDVDVQSLGDVARREAERRKEVNAGRVYTNDNLAPTDEGTPPPPAAADVPAAADAGTREAPPAAKPAGDPGVEPVIVQAPSKRTEAYWRKLMGDFRARLAQASATLATQQARLAAIDATPMTPTSAREREVVAASIPGLQENIRYQNEEIARFVTRAAAEKVPADWVR